MIDMTVMLPDDLIEFALVSVSGVPFVISVIHVAEVTTLQEHGHRSIRVDATLARTFAAISYISGECDRQHIEHAKADVRARLRAYATEWLTEDDELWLWRKDGSRYVFTRVERDGHVSRAASQSDTYRFVAPKEGQVKPWAQMPLLCPPCRGAGSDSLYPDRICETCQGRGYRNCDFCDENYAVVEHDGEAYCASCWKIAQERMG